MTKKTFNLPDLGEGLPDATIVELDPREGEPLADELKRQVTVLGSIFGKKSAAQAKVKEFTDAAAQVAAAAKNAGKETVAAAPLSEAIRKHWVKILLGAGLLAGTNSAFYVSIAGFVSYGGAGGGVDDPVLAAKVHRRFDALVGERPEPRAAPACKDNGEGSALQIVQPCRSFHVCLLCRPELAC